jgi:glutathione peroxidase-family protein
MKILKHSEDSELLLLDEITSEQLIALNDICKNYKSYLLQIIKLPEDKLSEFAPGQPEKARSAMRLQVHTCMAYEVAFSDVLSKGEKQNPKGN